MCFSAPVSFASGAALTAGGALTLKKAGERKFIPFAAIPLLFGLQQLIEGVIWVSFSAPTLNTAATYAYSVFSHVLWPVLIPISVLLMERDASRRRVLGGLAVLGIGVGAYLLYFLIRDSVTAEIVNNSIAYNSPHFYGTAAMIAYLLATCFSCLSSSHRMVIIFGSTLFLSFIMAYKFFNETFFSVWCFFAAILSVLVYLHFHLGARKPRLNQ